MDIGTVFHTGFDFVSYLQKLGDDGLKFSSRYEKLVLEEPLARLLAVLRNPLKILVLSEPWCPDCVMHVPLLARMAEAGEQIQLMIFPRDQYPDLKEHLALNGKNVIPAVLFLDAEYQEIGRWYERPGLVQTLLQTDDEQQKLEVKRNYIQGQYLSAAMAEMAALLSGWLDKQGGSRQGD